MARTILITGCSDGGLGAALAIQFHQHGDRVLATARNPAKMESLKKLGIETLTLDVLSDESIRACVKEASALTGGSLDMLINNAGAGYSMPILDSSMDEIERLYRLNVLSVLRVTQLFFPLLRAAAPGSTIVNQTSVASTMGLPWQGAYNSSKAAIANFSETMRLEFQPFGIKVIDLKTGAVKTPFFENAAQRYTASLPENSVYAPIKDEVEKVMNGDFGSMEPQDVNKWAKNVIGDLSKRTPSAHIWRGTSATLAWIGTFLPVGTFDSMVRKLTGTGILEKKLKEEEGSKKAS
ncbi:NADPH-dependent 1-acyl dihydroxyacetone phosphate reductase [Exophiala xenobiotica]|nr:NADPH-dependent 1-acyl dihydroxyacetone phosphate reductase [Exophiala xenobiotica]